MCPSLPVASAKTKPAVKPSRTPNGTGVTFYDRLAEIAGEYVKKGRPIYVEGRLKYGVYTDKTTGVEKNTVDIIATELQLLGGREGMGAPSGDDGGSRSPARAPAPAASKAPTAAKSGFDDMDDDIPF